MQEENVVLRAGLAASILKRINVVIESSLPTADIDELIELETKLNSVMESQWKQSYKAGSDWKEHIWKNNKSERIINPNPDDLRLSRLEEKINEIAKQLDIRG